VERPELKLVTADAARPAQPAAAALGVFVLAAAALATVFGADAARRPFDPAPLAESALSRTLATHDPQPARAAQDALRERLRRNPLDAASRTIAASLLAETAVTEEDRAAAALQAQAAVRLTPSDQGVAHGAAHVLARCGEDGAALAEIARMFAYAPGEAAATLAEIEPFVSGDRLEVGLPATPAAWLAWSTRLRQDGRVDEADARLAAILSRWPGDFDALRVAATIAFGSGRMDELRRLVPPSLTLPANAGAASLYALRAHSKAAAGDVAGSHADALRAMELSKDDPWVLTLAGDAVVANEPVLARDCWTRALYRLLAQPATKDGAIWLRFRIARLNDREGRAGDALREWRTILADRPDDGEAKRRVAELTGGLPR
jgi:hypothetical protein